MDVSAAGAAKIVVIIMMTWLIALADTTHIVVGSVEIFTWSSTARCPGKTSSGLSHCRRWLATFAAALLFCAAQPRADP
jgi:formate/nitrite transporter FocA (FNT family)